MLSSVQFHSKFITDYRWNIHSLDFGESYLTSDTRGFVLSVKDFSISFSADFLVNEADWYVRTPLPTRLLHRSNLTWLMCSFMQ